MDELSQMQLEAMARQGSYLRKWLEDSVAFDMAGLASSALAVSDVSDAAIRAVDSIDFASQAVIAFDTRMQELGASLIASSQLATDALALPREVLRGINLEPFRGVNLEPFRGLALDAVLRQLEPAAELTAATAAIIRDAVNAPIDGILRYESTLGELSSSLIGLHRAFAGVGTSFTVTLDKEGTDKPTAHKSGFELSAGLYETIPTGIQAEPYREADTTIYVTGYDELISHPPAQVIQLNTLQGNIGLGPLQIVSTSQSWSYTRSESAEGLHQFNFCGVGGDEMGSKVNLIADFVHWVVGNDESAKERILTAFLSSGSISTANIPLGQLTIGAGATNEPIGIRAKRLGVQTSRLERWDRIRQEYFLMGFTQARIAEIETMSVVAIRNDFRDMRKRGLLPPASGKSTP